MIVWLNGAFGAGKTQTAYALAAGRWETGVDGAAG